MKIVQAITILVCLVINPASSQKATKVTKSTYQKAAVMSYPSTAKGEGFKIFPSVGKASSLFTKASKGRRELDCIQCDDVGSVLYSQLGKSSKVSKTFRIVGTSELSLPQKEVEYKIFGKGDKYKRRQLTSKAKSGSIGSSLSLPNITGKASKKGKSGKPGSLPLKAGLSILDKEFRIFHHKHAGKSNKEAAAGLPSSSPSVSSVPSASPSTVPSSSSAPSNEPSEMPSESPAPTTSNSAKARKLKGESESKSAKASSSDDYYRRGRVMY